MSTVYYTIYGKHDKLDENEYPIIEQDKPDLKYAKLVSANNKQEYFVKLDDTGNLYDPLNTGYSVPHRKHKLLNSDKDWQFTKVPKTCFEYYINFLKSMRKTWLSQAEREFI
jgi:hypothetical protein